MASNSEVIDLLDSSDEEGGDASKNAAAAAASAPSPKRKAEESFKEEEEEKSKRQNMARDEVEVVKSGGDGVVDVATASASATDSANENAKEEAKKAAQEVIEIDSDDDDAGRDVQEETAASLQRSSFANAAAASHAAPQEPTAPKPTSLNVWVHEGDKGSVTTDILSDIQLLARNAQGGNGRTSKYFVTQCDPMTHFQQSDRWSCGFRNVQMLLSALVPKLTDLTHPYYVYLQDVYQQAETVTTDSPLVLPSIEQLQNQLEECWKEGFDPEGSAHFGGKIIGKKSLIGAVEVGFLLRYWNIDSCVVQFIRHISSRELLPLVVYRYFQRQQEQHIRQNRHLSQPTQDVASDCVQWAEQERSTLSSLHDGSWRDAIIPAANYDVMPLYLQWEGHSVTIVGIEPTASDWKDWKLLVLDPFKKGTDYTNNSSNNKGPIGFTLQQDGLLKPFRRSCREIIERDSQIVMAGTKIIPLEERKFNKGVPQTVTADEMAVMSVPRW